MIRLFNETKATIKRSPRGFVLIVVVMALAIITAVAVGEMAVVRSETVASVRVEDEVQARGVAEGCLTLLQTYVTQTMTNPARVDFDLVLDPLNDTPATGPATADDFLPRLTGTTNMTLNGQRWAALARGPAGQQGVCFMRIEDNSDDGLPLVAVPPSATGADEGPAPAPLGNNGVDNPFRDRDRAVYLTVIGAYPLNAALTGASGLAAYQNAHSRITLRRLFAVANSAVARPAARACGNVTFGNGTSLCNTGGIESGGDINLGGGAACSCGSISGNTVTAPAGQCGCCTTPPIVSSGSPQPCPPFVAPAVKSHLHVSGFGNPNDEANIDLGDTSVCKVFTRNNNAFIWDPTDNAPLTTLTTLYAGIVVTNGAVANQDCTSFKPGAGADVPVPCTWTFPASGTATAPAVTCAAAQSLCWKPMATFNGTDDTASFDAAFPGGQFEWASVEQTPEDLFFYKNIPVPFSKDRTKFLTAGFCGSTAAQCPTCCQNCGTVQDRTSANWLYECADVPTCQEVHAHSHWTNKAFPAPTVFVFEVAPKKLEIQQVGGDAEPIWATLLLNRDADMKSNTGFCAAYMPRGTTPGSGCRTPMNVRTIPSASCVTGNALIPASPYAPPSKRDPPELSYPVVYRADPGAGDCDFDQSNITLVGTVECPQVSIRNTGQCFVGDIVASGTSAAGAMAGCITAPDCTSASVCIDSTVSAANATIWAADSVCSGNLNNATINADIFTGGNTDFKNNMTVTGIIEAQGTINFKNNATLTAGSAPLTSTSTQGMTSFMECSW